MEYKHQVIKGIQSSKRFSLTVSIISKISLTCLCFYLLIKSGLFLDDFGLVERKRQNFLEIALNLC